MQFLEKNQLAAPGTGCLLGSPQSGTKNSGTQSLSERSRDEHELHTSFIYLYLLY